jgi:hypothetical protein
VSFLELVGYLWIRHTHACRKNPEEQLIERNSDELSNLEAILVERPDKSSNEEFESTLEKAIQLREALRILKTSDETRI